jgi:hypothetical protein
LTCDTRRRGFIRFSRCAIFLPTFDPILVPPDVTSMRCKTFLLAMLMVPGVAAAQGRPRADTPAWAMIRGSRPFTWYVDTARIAPSAHTTDVWVRYDHSPPERLPTNPPKWYSRVEMQERLDCDRGRVVDLHMRLLDARGSRVVADPPLGNATRTFGQHPMGTMMQITCNVLEARRRGVMRQMIQGLHREPVPGRFGPAQRLPVPPL